MDTAVGLLGPEWRALRRRLTGDLVLPADPDYQHARMLASAQYDDVMPAAIAYCASTRDVQAVIKFAAERGLHTVARSGGHSFGGYSATPGIVLDVSRLNNVNIRGPRVVAGPGVQQVDALRQLAPRGLMLAGGVCPNVCLGGFVQGGGVGFLTRDQGLACDRMVAATVVLADGRVVRASADENPDLLWALRGGGGGNFGVVTSYELRPVHVTTMTNYTLTWPWEAAMDVIEAWQSWVIASPTKLGASLGILNTDAESATPQVVVYGAWLGAADDLNPLLDRLISQAGIAPATRSVKQDSPYAAMMQWYGCADLSAEQCHRIGYSPEAMLPRTNYYATRNRLFGGPVPARDLRRVLETFEADGRGGQFRLLYFEALGGKANEISRTATAYVHRNSSLLVGYALSLTEADYRAEDVTAGNRWLADGFAALDFGSLHESYQNFIDPALPEWRQSYYAENYARLANVKRRYDPHRFFRFAQGVG